MTHLCSCQDDTEPLLDPVSLLVCLDSFNCDETKLDQTQTRAQTVLTGILASTEPPHISGFHFWTVFSPNGIIGAHWQAFTFIGHYLSLLDLFFPIPASMTANT